MDITSRKNEKVQHFKKLGASAAYRRECGEFVCDGAKLFTEAVKNGAQIKEVFRLPSFAGEIPAGAKVYDVTPEVMDAASPLTTARDVVFTVAIPPQDTAAIPAGAIILENVQDPGNVGTMIRTANALGIPAAVIVGACADVYSPKCVRATMGAVFREKIVFAELGDIRSSGVKIIGTALAPDAESVDEADLTGAAVVIGNEGSGMTDEMFALCDKKVIIPMRPECESLNASAAATIMMWEMRKCQS